MQKKKFPGATNLATRATGGASVSRSVGARQHIHAIRRKPLQSFDVPGTMDETVVVLSDLAPNSESHRHTHPGPEVGYVLEGSGSVIADDKKPIAFKAGDSYKLPASIPHILKSGPHGVKIVAVWTIEKGKPLATDLD